jgi:hypothetical protein
LHDILGIDPALQFGGDALADKSHEPRHVAVHHFIRRTALAGAETGKQLFGGIVGHLPFLRG